MSNEELGPRTGDIELRSRVDSIEASASDSAETFARAPFRSTPAAAPRVLFVDQSGQLGGAEFCLIPIVSEIRDHAEVLLLSDGPFRLKLQEQRVKVTVSEDRALVRLNKSKLNASSLMLIPAVIKRVISLARKAQAFDVLYLNSQKALLLGALGRVIHRKTTIWHVHDIVSSDHFGKAQLLAIRCAVALGVDTLIANSHASADAVCKLTGIARKDVQVIHNGVDLLRFSSIDSAFNDIAQLKSQLGLPKDKFLVGLFGRLAPWKGQHVALRALALAPGVHLVVVGAALFGEDAYARELDRLVEELGLQDRVSFVGFQDDVPQWMRAMNAIIHTSTAPEPFGLVLIEAMASRVPLIATTGGAVAEIVSQGQTGLTVAPSDPDALAKAIQYLQAEPHEALRMADSAHKVAIEQFSLARYTQKVVRVLRHARALARA